MAKKNRKLFPALMDQNNNQTADCPDFCDPNCPYPCYPDDPIFYLSPPPPSQPPPLLHASSTATHIPSYIIIVACLLASLLFLLGYYFLISKYCTNWLRSPPQPPNNAAGEEEEEETEDEAARVDHPIWYIATVGLQQAIINSITVCKYQRGEGLIEGTECSVCLGEFQEGETLRLLPKCNHAFHIPCIDTWLRSHTNCPLCRARIVSNNAISSPLDSTSQNPRSSGPNRDAQTIYLVGDDESSNVGHRNQEINTGVHEDMGRVGEEEGLNSNTNCGFGLQINLPIMVDEMKQVRRAFSMDYVNNQRVEKGRKSGSSDNEKEETGELGSSSSGEKSPDLMKRSLSCGGGMFLLPRHSRSHQHAVFPM